MRDWFERPPQPMTAYLADEPFDSSELIYEARWDGRRVMLAVRNGDARLLDRTGRDLSIHFPEIMACRDAIGAREALVDGMIIALSGGRPSPAALEARLRGGATEQALDSRREPAVFVAFDILLLDGEPLFEAKLGRRKELLKGILRQTPNLVLGTWVRGSGRAFLKQVGKVGIRGVVAKDLDSPYLPGSRSRSWLRMQRIKEQDCAICGFTEGMGRREGLLGSLVLGVWRDGHLVHAGQVGSGFDHATVIDLRRKLEPAITRERPFDDPLKTDRVVTWVTPRYTCEVQYQEWTADRKLRSPRFVRLRDKPIEYCDVEELGAAVTGERLPDALSA